MRTASFSEESASQPHSDPAVKEEEGEEGAAKAFFHSTFVVKEEAEEDCSSEHYSLNLITVVKEEGKSIIQQI